MTNDDVHQMAYRLAASIGIGVEEAERQIRNLTAMPLPTDALAARLNARFAGARFLPPRRVKRHRVKH